MGDILPQKVGGPGDIIIDEFQELVLKVHRRQEKPENRDKPQYQREYGQQRIIGHPGGTLGGIVLNGPFDSGNYQPDNPDLKETVL
jgi:hypothetical protein